MAHLFPIMLKLENKPCLVVGGGEVATRKVEDLLACQAGIKVVSPEATGLIHDWAKAGLIQYEARRFQPDDIEGMTLVISATNDDQINKEVADICRWRGIMINVVDDPGRCDFFVPAVVRQGSLLITISTEGKSPVLARLIKEELQQRYGDEYRHLIEILGEARRIIKESIPDIENRKEIFTELAAGQLLEMIRERGPQQAREWILSVYCGRGTEPPDSTLGD